MTTAVPPSFTPAATAACHPVAITSDSVSSDGMSAASGIPSVLTRLPSACVTREYSPWPLAVKPRLSHTDCTPAAQWAHVLSQWQKGTMTKSPGRKSRTALPTSSTTPTHSCPMVAPASTSLAPR